MGNDNDNLLGKNIQYLRKMYEVLLSEPGDAILSC